jgi:ankyrin repeat protein
MRAAVGAYGVQHKINIRGVCDYDGRTPLHLAASEGAFVTMEWLLQQDVNMDAVDRFGRTPLMDALLAERTTVAQLLLEVCSFHDVSTSVGFWIFVVLVYNLVLQRSSSW